MLHRDRFYEFDKSISRQLMKIGLEDCDCCRNTGTRLIPCTDCRGSGANHAFNDTCRKCEGLGEYLINCEVCIHGKQKTIEESK